MSYRSETEIGKEIIRHYGINFTKFKEVLAEKLENFQTMEEDSIVDLYNTYAHIVGIMGWEQLTEWAEEYFSQWNKKENTVYLKNPKVRKSNANTTAGAEGNMASD